MNATTQSNEPGTAEGETGGESGQAEPTLTELGQLLAADGTDESGDKGESDGGNQEETKPTKFNDLAGAVDMDLDALYKLGVQIEGVDEPVSVEDLKDHFKKAHDFDLQVLEFEEQRTKETNELVRAKAELNEILQALPANAVKPEVLQRIRDRAEQTATEQRQLTLEAIPTWKSDEARAADMEAMTEHLQDYGFPVNQLEALVDHRWQRYIRDNMLRERRVRAALEKVKAGKPDKTGKSTTQKKGASKGQTEIKVQPGQSKLEATLTSID